MIGAYLIAPKGASEFFAVLGASENPFDELHGAFVHKHEAEARAASLAREYSDYTTLQVVRVTLGVA